MRDSVSGPDAEGVVVPEIFAINGIQLRSYAVLGLWGLWDGWIRGRAIVAETKAKAYLSKCINVLQNGYNTLQMRQPAAAGSVEAAF